MHLGLPVGYTTCGGINVLVLCLPAYTQTCLLLALLLEGHAFNTRWLQDLQLTVEVYKRTSLKRRLSMAAGQTT